MPITRSTDRGWNNITFEWISGIQNKAAHCLSRLVNLPHDSKATVKMLTTSNSDGSAFNIRSKTSHQHHITINTDPSNTQPIKDTVIPDLTAGKGHSGCYTETPN